MENLSWGFQMTVLGMGLVFSLLALLWLLLTLVLKFDKEETEEDAPESEAPAETVSDSAQGLPVAVAAGDAPPSELVVAIALAVAKYKAQRMPPDLAAAITVAAIEHLKNVGRWNPPVARSYWPGTQPIRWTAEARERARQTNHWN